MVNWTNLKTLATESPLEVLKRRSPQFYERYADRQDEYGFDLKTFATYEPYFRFCFEEYFKIDLRGIENIPNEGRAIVVGNHSGVIPIDGAMMIVAMCNMHPSPRRIRYLITDWFFHLPFVSDWMRQTGQLRATSEMAQRVLLQDEVIGIYPEGIRGVGKPFRDRYRLLDFHPGFVKIAILTQSPIVPVATIGGDEIFPLFFNLRLLSQFLQLPFFPVTPAFPWLPFPLWITPLPVRWLINIHKPIHLGYPVERATDKKLLRRVALEIQYEIQKDLNHLYKERKTLFTGWDDDATESSKMAES